MVRKAKEPKDKKAHGHPSGYTPEIGDEICRRIAEGETLQKICETKGMPARSSVYRWLDDEALTDFAGQYARAREKQQDTWNDQQIEIADDDTNITSEHVQHRKLRIETRRWIQERINPAKYSSKSEVKHDASDAFLSLWQKIGGGT